MNYDCGGQGRYELVGNNRHSFPSSAFLRAERSVERFDIGVRNIFREVKYFVAFIPKNDSRFPFISLCLSSRKRIIKTMTI